MSSFLFYETSPDKNFTFASSHSETSTTDFSGPDKTDETHRSPFCAAGADPPEPRIECGRGFGSSLKYDPPAIWLHPDHGLQIQWYGKALSTERAKGPACLPGFAHPERRKVRP